MRNGFGRFLAESQQIGGQTISESIVTPFSGQKDGLDQDRVSRCLLEFAIVLQRFEDRRRAGANRKSIGARTPGQIDAPTEGDEILIETAQCGKQWPRNGDA